MSDQSPLDEHVTPTYLRRLDGLQERIGHRFEDLQLLIRALTHSSLTHEAGPLMSNNETLEFFGDSVLGMLISEELFQRGTDRGEGDLSKLRARLVRSSSLSHRALQLGLGQCLLLGRGEERDGGRKKSSILADAYEAVLAAIYLDGGIQAVRRFVLNQFEKDLTQILESKETTDYKSALQVLSQKILSCLPEYDLLQAIGPDHDKRFQVEVRLGKRFSSKAWGRSKKQAEQEAAKQCRIQLLEYEALVSSRGIGSQEESASS